MKVTDLRRKLRLALAAGGLIAPGAVYAADLNTNLLANPDFEMVNDTGTLGAYNTPAISNWTASAADKQGYAYSHNGSLSAGNVVPDYANGAPLASGGNWYFSPNAGPMGFVIDGPGQFYQDIDVSMGASSALIATGNAAFRISGFFNNFATQGDIGHLHLDFHNSSSVSIGTAEVTGVLPLNEWKQNSRGGLIPVGTSTVRVSIFGTTPVGGGPDGYTDNVEFQVTNEVIQPTLGITVNRDTGGITLFNQTGGPVSFKSYVITSAFGALDPANWLSIADNYDAGNPGPNQIDAANNWSELTDPAANGDLSEANLQTAGSGSIAHTRTLNLGNSAWIQNPNEDLVFQYISGNQIVQGIVNYVGNDGIAHRRGDFDADGDIDVGDWVISRSNQRADMSSLSLTEAYLLGDLTGDKQNNHADFVAFKQIFDAQNGSGSFAAMLHASAAAVPEPGTTSLIVFGGAMLAWGRRKQAPLV
jgi:hypothetical protein